MLDLLDGGVNQMVAHLEEVTEKDSVVEVNIKDVFQKMTLDVIARSSILHETKETKKQQKQPNNTESNQNITQGDKNNLFSADVPSALTRTPLPTQQEDDIILKKTKTKNT